MVSKSELLSRTIQTRPTRRVTTIVPQPTVTTSQVQPVSVTPKRYITIDGRQYTEAEYNQAKSLIFRGKEFAARGDARMQRLISVLRRSQYDEKGFTVASGSRGAAERVEMGKEEHRAIQTQIKTLEREGYDVQATKDAQGQTQLVYSKRQAVVEAPRVTPPDSRRYSEVQPADRSIGGRARMLAATTSTKLGGDVVVRKVREYLPETKEYKTIKGINEARLKYLPSTKEWSGSVTQEALELTSDVTGGLLGVKSSSFISKEARQKLIEEVNRNITNAPNEEARQRIIENYRREGISIVKTKSTFAVTGEDRKDIYLVDPSTIAPIDPWGTAVVQGLDIFAKDALVSPWLATTTVQSLKGGAVVSKFQKNLEKSKIMLSESERQSALATKERFNMLEGLEKTQQKLKKFGVDITDDAKISPREELITTSKWKQVGTGEEVLSSKEITSFAKEVRKGTGDEIFKTEKEGIKYIKEVGRYKQPIETKLPSKVDLYKGTLGDIKVTKDLPPLKYSSDIGVYKADARTIEVSFVDPKITKRIGYQYQLGKGGRPIAKEIYTGISKTGDDLTSFEVFKTARKSTSYYPTQAGYIKIDKTPAAKLIRREIVKSKIIDVKTNGGITSRKIFTEQKGLFTKPERVSEGRLFQSFNRKPPKESLFDLGTTIKRDISVEKITKGEPVIDVNIFTDKKTGFVLKGKVPFKTETTGIRVPKDFEPLIGTEGEVGKTIIGSGKKSSQGYIQSLYTNVQAVTPSIKPKIIPPRVTKTTPPTSILTSQELAPVYVGGMGKGQSAYYGQGFVGEEAIIYTTTTIPVTRTTLSTTPATVTIPKVKTDTFTKTLTASSQDFKTDLAFKTGQMTKTGLAVRTDQTVKTDQALKSAQALKTTQALKTDQAVKSISNLRSSFRGTTIRTPRMKIPRTPLVVVDLKSTPSKTLLKKAVAKLELGYIAEIKRQGKWIPVRPVSKTPLTRIGAIKIGEKKVRETLAASFRIKPSGQLIQATTKELSYTPSGEIFRSYRKKKGAIIPLKDEWIQLAGKRLSARSEVSEILKSKRSKNLKWL